MTLRQGLKATKISWFEGLIDTVKRGLKGLSIVILQTFSPNRQIVISLYQFVDNWGYAGYKGLVTMKDRIVNHPRGRGFKDIHNTPSNRQTISSGYKGLGILGYKGLKV